MATAAVDLKRQHPPMTEQPMASSGPPSYYVAAGPSNAMAFGGAGPDPTCGGFMAQAPLLHATSQAPTVMVTQPVVMAGAPPPDTMCAFIMSTLSAILCGFWCGAIGILLSWKAKIQVLDKKYEHARHSLRITWLFFSLACLFGGAVWTVVGIYLYLITSSYSWRYYRG